MSSEFDATASIVMSGVSKKYRLFDSPTDRLLEAVWPYRKRHSDFWALRDIDLCIRKGETVGIVGRNGSGKSTLLQIIAGIFAPTSGTLTVNGRVSALLELGAGFNPEFSGRDNAVMNGVFRGLSAREMNEKLPEIEAFADIGQFFDRPVKTYSSGMFVRVAFAAAISIEPDILLVDEALAVGDVKFQHKCFGAIREMQKNGVTIVLVTHDIQAVVRHCDRAIVLDGGFLLAEGPPKSVTDRFYAYMLTGVDPVLPAPSELGRVPEYMATSPFEALALADPVSFFLAASSDLSDNCKYRVSYNEGEVRFGDGRSSIIDYLLVCSGEVDLLQIASGSTIDVYLKVAFYAPVSDPCYGFALKTKEGVLVFGSNLKFEQIDLAPFAAGDVATYKLSLTLDVNAGDYFLTHGVGAKTATGFEFMDTRQGLMHIHVVSESTFDGLAALDFSFSEVSRSVVGSATVFEKG